MSIVSNPMPPRTSIIIVQSCSLDPTSQPRSSNGCSLHQMPKAAWSIWAALNDATAERSPLFALASFKGAASYATKPVRWAISQNPDDSYVIFP